MKRRHPLVTECIKVGETVLVVWPDEKDLLNKKSMEKYLSSVSKIGNDPRVGKVQEDKRNKDGFIFIIDSKKDAT